MAEPDKNQQNALQNRSAKAHPRNEYQKKSNLLLTNTRGSTIIELSKKVKVKIVFGKEECQMARLVDVIEAMIKDMIDENDGQATINRSILAEQANCVPSQITYVLSTRFSSGNGYIVESRRGGGGQITITRVNHVGPAEYLKAIIDSVGDDLSQQQAKNLLTNAVTVGAMTSKEGTAIMAAVSDRALARVDSDIRSVLRADIFKHALLGLMVT